MTGLIGLIALVGGMVSAVALPVVTFVVGLLAAAITAALGAGLAGVPAGQAWLWAADAYVAAQVGYGLGLAALAFGWAGRRRERPSGRDPDQPA